MRRAPRPHEPVTEHVLLADDEEFLRLEPVFEANHASADMIPRQRQRGTIVRNRAHLLDTAFRDQPPEALPRARRPAATMTRLRWLSRDLM